MLALSALALAAGTGAAAVAMGCSSPAVEASYDDPTPDARLSAIAATTAERRKDDAPRLVQNLASDDPAVRLAAAESLRQITGETLGYRASAPRAERDEAILRWKAWLRSNGLTPPPAPQGGASDAPSGA